jgi:hypothetical protein
MSEQRLYTAPELAEFCKEQHAEITRLDILLAVKDQEIAQLKAALAAAHTRMDPYEVACEIASLASPTNEDMRRLRAAEVAIAYCGRPRVTESRSVSIVGYGDVNGLAARLERARMRVVGKPDDPTG